MDEGSWERALHHTWPCEGKASGKGKGKKSKDVENSSKPGVCFCSPCSGKAAGRGKMGKGARPKRAVRTNASKTNTGRNPNGHEASCCNTLSSQSRRPSLPSCRT